MLVAQFTHKHSDYKFVVFSCYLPPERSNRGRDAQGFFAHILSQIYLFSDCDAIFVSGDLNARLGSMSDTSGDFDLIPDRQSLDNTINQHGHDLCEFLTDSKFCVLNGRFDSSLDNFTSISQKGRATVDYICVPHDVFHLCKYFKVLTVESIVNEFNLHQLIGTRSKLPDHCFLVTEFEIGYLEPPVNNDISNNGNATEQFTPPRFKLKRIPPNFMESVNSALAISELISQIECARETQCEIDTMYTKLCDIITLEMRRTVPMYTPIKKTRKRYKSNKPYWSEALTNLWETMRDRERDFVKFKGPRAVKTALHRQYKNARFNFDKLLRQSERSYRQAIADDIESTSTGNPNEFWDKIKSLGPRKDRTIPLHIHDADGSIISDENRVFERWKADFQNLYNCESTDDFDEVHYDRAKFHKTFIENKMLDPLYLENVELNRNITIEELTRIVMHTKNNSSTGYDAIPYEVLKFPPVIGVLHKLFQLIFDTSIIPSIWRKSIICPIHKDPTSDKSVPLNYRGISLLSCVSKVYSSFINKRLSGYLENNNILGDEQNGFRSNRSCEDHVFVLNSLIRNKTNVFTAFIDLRKAFDFKGDKSRTSKSTGIGQFIVYGI